jgi:hypothetical protein
MRVALLLLCSFFAATTLTAGERKDYTVKDKEFYKAGYGESVAKWNKVDFEPAKAEAKPMCIYIYDPEDKNATRAKLLESPNVLGHDNVKTRLETFQRIKMTADTGEGKKFEDVKGWPSAWLFGAKASCSLILASSDLRMTQIYDKNTPKEMITHQHITAVLDSIIKYEAHLKAEADKAAAKAAAKAPKPAEEAKEAK